VRLVDFYQNRTISAHLGCSRSILEKSLLLALSVFSIWLVSFSPQASFESIYTASESPFFSLSNDVFKWSWLFFFRWFLWTTMFMVVVSCCTPPDKLDLLRAVNNVEPGQITPHSIALWKLYTRTPQNLRIFVGNRFFFGPECRGDW
jgi:hypothetical protein